MGRDDEYRTKAIECAEAAERAHDLHERLELLKMAQAWIRLAEHARRSPDRLPPQRKSWPQDGAGAGKAEP